MRYFPGTISLSEGRDLPILRVVLHSRFISHRQLFELMQYETYEPSVASFDNRVLRLLRHGLLHTRNIPDAGRVYSITTAGLAPLIRRGESYTLAVNEKIVDPNSRVIAHCLDINDIHVSLKKSGLLARWIPETAVRSRNELTNIGYAKDYDAVFGFRLRDSVVDFALEYERSPKATRYYDWIRQRIEAETQVGAILYICANFDLLTYVAGRLRGCRKPIYFGMFGEFVKGPRLAGLVSQHSLAPTSLERLAGDVGSG